MGRQADNKDKQATTVHMAMENVKDANELKETRNLSLGVVMGDAEEGGSDSGGAPADKKSAASLAMQGIRKRHSQRLSDLLRRLDHKVKPAGTGKGRSGKGRVNWPYMDARQTSNSN